jgi:hypothetical protein
LGIVIFARYAGSRRTFTINCFYGSSEFIVVWQLNVAVCPGRQFSLSEFYRSSDLEYVCSNECGMVLQIINANYSSSCLNQKTFPYFNQTEFPRFCWPIRIVLYEGNSSTGPLILGVNDRGRYIPWCLAHERRPSIF